MYHVSAQGVDERMINVNYYYYLKLRKVCLFYKEPLGVHQFLPGPNRILLSES